MLTIQSAGRRRTDPAAGALVAELLQAEVAFSEAVTGVNASDLLVNGSAAGAVRDTVAPVATVTPSIIQK